MSENNSEKLLTKDEALFDFFLKTEPSTFERLKPTINEEEKAKFFASNFSQNPLVHYEKLDLNELQKQQRYVKEEGYFLTQAYIDSRDLSASEKDSLLSFYYPFLAKRIKQYDLLIASSTGDMERFSLLAEQDYGKPSPEIFNTYLKNLGEELTEITEEPATTIANELLNILPKTSGKTLTEKEINVSTFKEALSSKMEKVIEFMKDIQPDIELDANTISNVFKQALSVIGAEDWSVEITDKYLAVTVRSDFKEVMIPIKRKLKKNALLGLVAHEIFTHVLRRVNSEKLLPYTVLQSGLPGYTEAEEAIAEFSEKAFNEKKTLELDGGILHFAVSLALGMDGVKRDFKDVFQIIYNIRKFRKLKKVTFDEKSDEEIKESTWNTCIRVFRGTDFQTKGVCFPKDIAYGEGRLQLVKYLEGGGKIDDFFDAKFSPWDEEHRKIISQYRD